LFNLFLTLPRPLNIPMENLVIYEMHVRGFTQHETSNVSARGGQQGRQQYWAEMQGRRHLWMDLC
jgi:pullulanase/glycogen debranching enzyme